MSSNLLQASTLSRAVIVNYSLLCRRSVTKNLGEIKICIAGFYTVYWVDSAWRNGILLVTFVTATRCAAFHLIPI